MIQVRVLGVALDPAQQHIVLLKPLPGQPESAKLLPIWIGEQEATSILVGLGGTPAPRPLSHDLITSLFTAVGARLERVDVTRLEAGTFYAELTLATPTGVQVIDARPSDALALAVRGGVPIRVAEEVFEDAGVPAELADTDDEDDEGADGAIDLERDADAAAKLDEFKRFLDKVDPEDFQG